MQLFGVLVFIFLSSLVGTWGLKRYALAKQIMDIPNARSSHSSPTPRGGGLAFVIVFLFSVATLTLTQVLEHPINQLALISLAMVALLGFYDDKKTLSPLVRCIVQLISACLMLYAFNPLPSINLYIFQMQTGIILNSLMILYTVWLLNLFNFMDGINGIASVEALTVCIGMVLIFCLGGCYQLAFIPAILCACVLGFIPWNFPKAQIFMGDAGSSFLGFALALLSLEALTISADMFWSCLVMLGVFIVDASVTLFRRALRGEKIYMAHCSHAYQNAAKLYGSHITVTLAVLIINLTWLLPIALLISLHYLNGLLGLLLAYLPLYLTSIYFNAGKA